MLLATDGDACGVLRLDVKRSKIPNTTIFKHLNKLTILQKTNDTGAIECLVGTHDETTKTATESSVPITASLSS